MYEIQHVDLEKAKTMESWAAEEGWNPGLHDMECFHPTDPTGFFAGVLDGEIICTGSAVIYNDDFAFFGFYICAPDYRDHGYGIQLTRARLDYVGDRCTGLDGVINMLDKYRRNGFEVVHNNIRFAAKAPSSPVGVPSPRIRDARQIPASVLADFDEAYFPARREEFLQRWVQQPNTISLAYTDTDKPGIITEASQLKGLIVCRKCREGYKVGPLYAQSPDIARELLAATLPALNGETFFLDVPEPNKDALALCAEYDMQKVFETARMYRNGNPNLPLDEIYGITTYELG